jgi:hypothetical protein
MTSDPLRTPTSASLIWRTWLIVVGVGIAAGGVAMAVASGTPLFEPVYRLIDPAFWASGPPDAGTVSFRAWAIGAWAATIAGWGIVVTFVAHAAFGREAWAWRALALATGTWFVLDTGISLLHGVGMNVAFNVVVLALVAVPLLATRGTQGR